MKSLYATYLPALVIAFAACGVSTVSAAPETPSCVLEAGTNRGTVETSDSIDILVPVNHQLSLSWESDGATKAKSPKGIRPTNNGSIDLYPKKTTTYQFSFSNGSKKVRCSVTAHVANATFDYYSLTSQKSKPHLTGGAEGVKSVRLEFKKDTFAEPFYTTKEIRVKKGRWEFKMPQSLADGTYQVNIYASEALELGYFVTGTLTITSQGLPTLRLENLKQPRAALVEGGDTAEMVRFRVTNTSKGLATLSGAYVTRVGSADDSSIISLGIVDDKGEANGLTGGTEGYDPFGEHHAAVVPFGITMKPGDSRIFTITAGFSESRAPYGRETIGLEVYGIATAAAVTGGTIRGELFTLK